MKISIDKHAQHAGTVAPNQPGKDYVALAEGGYWLGGSDADWMAMLLRHVRVLLDAEVGVFGWGYRLGTGAYDLEIVHPTFVECPEGFAAVMDETTKTLSQMDLSQALLDRIYHGPSCLPNLADLVRSKLEAAASVYYSSFQPVGVGGLRMFRSDCGDRTGVCLCANRLDDRPLNRAQATALERTAAHIAAGYRIRRAMASTGAAHPDAGSDDGLEVDAIVSTDGNVLHAEGDAKSNQSLMGLRHAVERMETSRGRLRREDPLQAIELWRALVSGRWSLLEYFDSDGKRMLLARKNTPETHDLKALTEEERAVASYAACGHSNKLIAYEVGLHESTVSRRLDSALKKLGFRSRVEFVTTMTRARHRPPE